MTRNQITGIPKEFIICKSIPHSEFSVKFFFKTKHFKYLSPVNGSFIIIVCHSECVYLPVILRAMNNLCTSSFEFKIIGVIQKQKQFYKKQQQQQRNSQMALTALHQRLSIVLRQPTDARELPFLLITDAPIRR